MAMTTVPADLKAQLHESGQEHVLAWWDDLTDAERRGLLEQLKTLDLRQLRQLYANRDHAYEVPAADRITPPPIIRLDAPTADARRRGEDCLRRGEVAVLLVAGGQGTRLGFDQPKGMFPIAPVSRK